MLHPTNEINLHVRCCLKTEVVVNNPQKYSKSISSHRHIACICKPNTSTIRISKSKNFSFTPIKYNTTEC